ncbi:DUF2510 domain-containing protein [Actinocorallia longicatena]|uniref:DUF2510 domain-containing protein n=1 Tax=Actinocorallia longicatena TaxID=111803 RepID=A0ABP6QPB5_9ACTN
MTGQTPPGWYPDPHGTPGLQRWWDGGQWTSSTQPAAGGARTPEPWQPPSSTPQPWAPQQGGPVGFGGNPLPPQRRNQNLVFGLIGGVLVVVVLAAVAIIFVVRGGDDPDPIVKPTTPITGSSSLDTSGRSPVVGTQTDDKSGLNWAQLGGGWTVQATVTGSYAKLGLIKGEQAVVQKDYKGPGSDYVATVFAAVLPDGVFYSNGDLEGAAKSWFGSVRPGFYPEHTVEDVSSRAYSVSGKKAWYYEVKVSFPQAESQGWNFRTERAIIVLVDRPGEQPAGLYLSIPDSHKNQGDVQVVLDSLKAP